MLKDNPATSDQARHVLVADVLSNCNNGTPVQNINGGVLSNNSHEFLGENMRLARLQITPLASGFYSVTVRIVYGEPELLCSPGVAGDCALKTTTTYLNAADLGCKGFAGSQFCSASELTTTVQRRIQ
jgi:hypothetical protein